MRIIFGFPLLCSVVTLLTCGNPQFASGFDLNNYHSYDEIVKYLNSLQSKRVSVTALGHSSENRVIPLVKIKAARGNASKAILIDACTHAREWISVASAINLIANLSGSHDLPNVDVYIVPLVNPDGYEYTRTKDRMWRSTRSGTLKCGADINRNYPMKWGFSGTSNQVCTEIYRGPRPLSEPETIAMASFMKRNVKILRAYVSLHSFENSILIPYGYSTGATPKNFADLTRVAKLMAKSMNSVHGNNITTMKSSSLYPASGCADDYAHSIGIPYAYTIELTTGFYKGKYVGFQTPRSMIKPTSDELRAGIGHLMREVSQSKKKRRRRM